MTSLATRRSSRAPARCPLCQEAIDAADIRRCYGCHTRYHLTCLSDLGAGCATVDCVGRVLGPRVPPSGRTRLRPKVRPVRTRGFRQSLWALLRSPWIGPAILAGLGAALLIHDPHLLELLVGL